MTTAVAIGRGRHILRAMAIEATGKLHTIFETTKVSERFTKREFVVEMSDNPKYPQTVLFQLSGDRCEQLDSLKVGDEVRIEFSLRGREWRSPKGEVKYFNSLDVWKVEPARAGASAGGGRSVQRSGPGGGGGGPRGGASIPRGDDIPLQDDDEYRRGGDRGRNNNDDGDLPF